MSREVIIEIAGVCADWQVVYIDSEERQQLYPKFLILMTHVGRYLVAKAGSPSKLKALGFQTMTQQASHLDNHTLIPRN